MTVRIHSAAEAEAESARQYLDGQSRGLGGRFLDDLTRTLAAIADRPLSFPKLVTLPDSIPYRRALLDVFRYAVVFEIAGEEIVVLAIVHCSRAPNYWLRRR